MQTTCNKCGNSFTCGASTGACWCMDLPRTHPMPVEDGEGCFCKACLAEQSQSSEGMPNKCVIQKESERSG